MHTRVLRFAEGLTRITETIGALLMAGILVINFLQVFFRYVLFDPLGWTEEAMRYSVAWLTFLVAGAVLFRGEQLSIDLLSSILPARFRRAQHILVLTLTAMFCLILVVYGWPQAMRNMSQHSPVAQIPMIIPYLSVVVGGLLMLTKAICLIIADPDRLNPDMGGLE